MSAPTILRGEVDPTALQETLQVGYLHAVAAAAGCALSSPWPDVLGTDWNLEHPHSQHVEDPVSMLRLQLKATYQVSPADLVGKNEFSFTMENEHLAKLNHPSPTITRLLVVMVMPNETSKWVTAAAAELSLRHCCYWVNLAGKTITGKKKTNVRVPIKNVFDDVALCGIMAMIGQGVVPK